jgi:hypothetical protein
MNSIVLNLIFGAAILFKSTNADDDGSTCFEVYSDVSDDAFNSRMATLCPGAENVDVKAPDFYGPTAHVCGRRARQKHGDRLRLSLMNHLFFSASPGNGRCDAWCVGDINNTGKRHFRWNPKKGCWKFKKRNSKCFRKTQEQEWIKQRRLDMCSP